ncbi:MAG: S9 family peptidase [bacterium]|nr:S9 family peptidase [bacterium]
MTVHDSPRARTVEFAYQHLGEPFPDPYKWLENKQDAEVIAYLEAENAYAAAALAHTAPLQETLYQEMVGRIKEDDDTVPERRGAYWYYTRTEAGQQYRIFCRRRDANGAPGGAEEILLDENQLAEGHTYCRVASFEPSPDESLIAYSVDTTGAWVYTVTIIDAATRQTVAGGFDQADAPLAWANDSKTLFFTLYDAAHRPFQLMRFTIGTDAAPTLIYHETDDAFFLNVRRARSGGYLFLASANFSTSEMRCLPADDARGTWRVIEPRTPWVEYYAEHQGDTFWISTNENAENFKLMAAPAADPAKANWREVIPHRADTLIESCQAFRDTLVLVERRDGLQQIRLSAPDAVTNVRYIAFPESVYMFRLDANPLYDQPALRLMYASPITPQSTVEVDLASGAWDVKKRQEIPSGYDASQYECVRLFATSHDGAWVPMSVVYKKGIAHDGTNPALLYGYGSYGYSMDAGFNTRRFSLLDRGFVFAIGHIRGGSEMGRAWYEQGRLMHKKNTFLDFIACAETLIAQGFTAPGRLAIMGGSAGGLLVTAAANLRPDLFRAVVALVPFTNVVSAMLQPELPLTIPEYEQWGNPNTPEAFAYMRSYSPYDNIEAKAYPQFFIRAGLHDLQVPYWDPAKFAARLRATKTDDHPVYLLTNMGSGHAGASGRYDVLREEAETYAFLIHVLA